MYRLLEVPLLPTEGSPPNVVTLFAVYCAAGGLICSSTVGLYRKVPNLRSYHNLRVGFFFHKNREFSCRPTANFDTKVKKRRGF